ncbi:YadA-like family protein [Enterobacter sp. RIT637]|uniref:YadA-like family protein n=1 Tax=Enterobacter sp. RIT637 TaxID=2870470 RepID=UPI001C86C028|nr:YadA-like family protein [Enterobacter sp. RIT637]MBX8459411.1 YadA-like family protein [Enterobacter sp. RIT637]
MKKTLLATVVLTAITSQAGAATQEQTRTIGEGYQHAVRFNMTDVHNPDTLIDAHKLAHNPLFADKEIGQKAQALMTHIYDAWAEQKDHLPQKEAPYPLAAPQLEAPYADPIAKPQSTPVKAPVSQQQTPVKQTAPALNPQPNRATPEKEGQTPEYAQQRFPIVEQKTPVAQPLPTAQEVPVASGKVPTVEPHLIPTIEQKTPVKQAAPTAKPYLIPAIQQQTPVKPAAPKAQPALIPTIQQQTPTKQAAPTAQPYLIPTIQQQTPVKRAAPALNPQPNRAIPSIQGETPEYARQLFPREQATPIREPQPIAQETPEYAKQLLVQPTPNHATPSYAEQTPTKQAAPEVREQFTPDPLPNEGLAHAVRYNMTDVHNPDTLIHQEKLAHNPLFADKDVAQKAQDHVSHLMAIKLEQEGHYEARQAAASQNDAAQGSAHLQSAAVVVQPAPVSAPANGAAAPAAPSIDPAVQTALDEKAEKTDLATLRTQFNKEAVNRINSENKLGTRIDNVESDAAAAKAAQVTRDDDQDIRFNKQKAAQKATDDAQDAALAQKASTAALNTAVKDSAKNDAHLQDQIDNHETRIATLENAPKPQDGKDGAQGQKGDKGDKGDRGDQGIQGQQGATGAAGQDGQKGDKGDTGATGAQGLKGDKGDTGAAGTNGTNGVDGKDGKDGLNGADGKDGAQGLKGDKGDTGAAGKDVDPTVVNQLKDGIKTNGDAVKTNKDAIDQNEANIAAAVLKANANEQGVADNSKGIATNNSRVQKNAAAIKLHEDHAQTLAQGELTIGKLAVQNNKTLTKQAQDFTALQTEVKQKVDTSVFQQRSAVVDQRFADTDARIHQQKIEQDKTNQKVAANSKQLANHEVRITDLEANNKSNFNKLEAQQNKDRKEFRAGVAGAVALTQIPQVQADQSGNFGMAVGTFNGENAVAAGVSTRVTKSVTVKSGLSWDTQGNVGAGAGVAIGW